jgi:intein/homing endonuclease
MLLTHTGARFELNIPFEDKILALYNGFMWDGRVWWTGTGAIANHFSNWADRAAYDYLQDFNQRVSDSHAKDSIYDYPCPKGLAYLNYQKGGVSYSLERADTLLGDGMRLGKEQPLDARILTPDGWKFMGSIRVGELVIGSNGKPCKVKAVFPQGLKSVFKVIFTDGATTECGLEHMWLTVTPSQKGRGKLGSLKKLAEIKKQLKYSNGNLCHYIPIVEPVEFNPDGALPLHPYALGYLLGNGCFRQDTPGVTIPIDSEEVKAKLEKLLPVTINPETKSKIDYKLCKKNGWGSLNPLTNILRSLNLMGKYSWEKHIPRQYLFSSVADREELVRGLLDADACRAEQGSPIEYSTSSKQLADELQFVLLSLGCTTRRHLEKEPKYTYRGETRTGRPSHTLIINPRKGFELFYLKRKQRGENACPRKFYPTRAIASVEPNGIKECQCISVDSPDGLYVTDDFIVTHNTPESIGVINADRSIESGLVITKASLKINWERELEKWLVRDMSVSICPSGNEAIPNTDIVITNYENVPKQKSSIMKRKWGIAIFDESHKLANPKAQRTVYCLGRTFRRKLVEPPIVADRRLFLSGTPITKRPVNLWPIAHACDPGGLGRDWHYYTQRYCGAWKAPWGVDVTGKSHLNEFQDRLRSTFMIRRVREEVLTELPQIRRMIVPLIPEGVKKLIEQERTLFGNKADVLKIAQEKAINAQRQGDELAYTKAVDELEKLKDIAMSMMAKIRHETAIAKIPYIIDMVEDVLEEEQKVVVFAHHREVIATVTAQLCKNLKNKFAAVCHYGDISAKEKQKSIDTFNTSPRCHVFVAAISGAEGYDIAVSSYGLFAEYDWTAGTMQQAEDRLFAIGKVDSILYQYLVWDGSLDANMAKDYVESSETIFRAIG